MNTVQQILDRKGGAVNTIAPKETVLTAAHLMNNMRIGSLIVTENNQVRGIVTERDMLRRVLAAERDPASTRVEEVMTRELKTASPETTLEECRELMTQRRIRHLPVLRGQRLLGIITIGDLMAQQIEDGQTTIEYLNAYMEMPPIPSRL